jgi:hypothetical protein
LNVVLVALGDQLLDDTFVKIKQDFPKLEFRKVRSARQQHASLL